MKHISTPMAIRLTFILALLVTLYLAGCTTQRNPAESARAGVSDAASGVAGVVAHTQSAQRQVDQAIPYTDDTGKMHLAAATDEHAEVLADAAETLQALDATSKEISVMECQMKTEKNRYSLLESEWYVRWGRWLERALWILGLSWLGLGVASIVFGIGNPLSTTFRIGKEITRMVPLMNPFSWVRNWILARRKAAETNARPEVNARPESRTAAAIRKRK